MEVHTETTTPRKSAKSAPKGKSLPVLRLEDPAKPITAEDVKNFMLEHGRGNPFNVEIVHTTNLNPKAARPLPFSAMDRKGRRAEILWALVNGVGPEHDRSLSAFERTMIDHGSSAKQKKDLLAAMNGGYSRSSPYFGTAFVELHSKTNE